MASDYLLELEGIKGESKDSQHPNAIEIETFSWSNSNPINIGSAAGGAGVGKVKFSTLDFTTKVNKASPELMVYCSIGKPIPKAKLFVRKQGEGQKDFYVIMLESAFVSFYQSGAAFSGATALPVDQFSLAFMKILFEYRVQKEDGSLEAPVTGGFDVVRNKRIGSL